MPKGSSFEREICKLLSLWWTEDKRDDVFWRTAGSGAMAKTRSKIGKKTFGQCGDVQATDPIGQPLIDICSIELKRGYSGSTSSQLIDKPDGASEQQYEKFIEQAIEDCKNSNARTWLLIIKRDRRKTLIFMPNHFYMDLKEYSMLKSVWPLVMFRCIFKNKTKHIIYGTTLEKFLKYVTPKHIKKIRKEFCA